MGLGWLSGWWAAAARPVLKQELQDRVGGCVQGQHEAARYTCTAGLGKSRLESPRSQPTRIITRRPPCWAGCLGSRATPTSGSNCCSPATQLCRGASHPHKVHACVLVRQCCWALPTALG